MSAAPVEEEAPEVMASDYRMSGVRRRQRRLLVLQAVFGLLGVGVLVPWNAFISAKGYFVSRLCTLPSIASNVESVFAVAYNLSAVLSMGLVIAAQWIRDQVAALYSRDHPSIGNTASTSSADITDLVLDDEDDLHHRNHHGNNSSVENGRRGGVCNSETDICESTTGGHSYVMVMVPMGLTLAVFLGQSVLAMLLDISPEAFEIMSLFSLCLCGISITIASAGVVATAGLFPADRAMNPFLAGQSLGGVLVSFASFVAAFWEDPAAYWHTHCNATHDDNGGGSGNATATLTTMTPIETSPSMSLDTYFMRLLQLDGENESDGTCSSYNSVDWASFFYFLMGSVTLGGCLIGYSYVDRFQKAEHRNEYETVGDGIFLAAGTTSSESLDSTQVVDQSPRIGLEMNDAAVRHAAEPERGAVGVSHEPEYGPNQAILWAQQDSADAIHPHHVSDNETTEVWSRVKGPAIAVYLSFFVTLSLFPGWTSELRSVRQCQTKLRLINDLYTPFSFLLFNIGDFGGRLLAAKMPLSRIPGLSGKLVTGALLRFLFFPLLFLCVGGATSSNRLQVPSDLFSVVVQFLFAVSNGCLVSAAFAHAPSLLHHTTHEQERMSEILTFSLVFGLLSGSLFSWPVTELASRR